MTTPFDDDDGRDEGGPGLVGRLLQRGAAAPNVAMKLLAEQVSGWKKDFLGIFQSEIRRFLDRQDPGVELRKMIEGKRLEVSIRLVDEDAGPVRSPSRTSSKPGRPKPDPADPEPEKPAKTAGRGARGRKKR